MSGAAGAHEGLHVSSVKFNAIILVALLVLTGLTYWTATLDLGFFDTPLAMAIAILKTTLVILFFMHVRWSSSYVMILAASGFAFLILLFGFTFADIVTRTQEMPWNEYTWPGAAHRSFASEAHESPVGVEGVVPDIAEPEHHQEGGH